MKKLIFILMLAVLFTSLLSCAKAGTEEEIIAAAKELLPKSVELNEIYFGVGLPHIGTAGESIMYATVSEDAKYKTEDELRTATLSVFTENYASFIFNMYLLGYSDEGTGDIVYARYVQYEDRLTVNVKSESTVERLRGYDLETVKVEKIGSKDAVISVDSVIDGVKDERIEVTLVMSEASDGTKMWRIDSPTY